jgi:hypothetical protein
MASKSKKTAKPGKAIKPVATRADKPTVGRARAREIELDKWRAAVKAKFIELIEQPMAMGVAAKLAGTNRGTIYEWIDADPDFRDAVAEAREVGTDHVEDIVTGLANQTEELSVSLRAAMSILAARRPKEWGPKATSIGVESETPNGTTRIGIKFYGEEAPLD